MGSCMRGADRAGHAERWGWRAYRGSAMHAGSACLLGWKGVSFGPVLGHINGVGLGPLNGPIWALIPSNKIKIIIYIKRIEQTQHNTTQSRYDMS